MIDLVRAHVIPAAYELLPPHMASPRATALLLAIGYQESKFQDRVQVVMDKHGQRIDGRARGFWQFEGAKAATEEVVTGHKTSQHARNALAALRYPRAMKVPDIHAALAHNDILAAVFARLLLWTVPEALPEPNDEEGAWQQYLSAWHPGKPRRQDWPEAWRRAWA